MRNSCLSKPIGGCVVDPDLEPKTRASGCHVGEGTHKQTNIKKYISHWSTLRLSLTLVLVRNILSISSSVATRMYSAMNFDLVLRGCITAA